MKKSANRTRGFTLIELLVVIAIIGILSSVVLVSLGSARNKATNVRILANVRQIRTQLESNYLSAYADIIGTANNTASVDSASSGGANIAVLVNDIGSLNGNATVATIGGISVDLFGTSTSPILENGLITEGYVDTGVVIFTTSPFGSLASDYAIYATTTVGYTCADSSGTIVKPGEGTLGTITSISQILDGNNKVVCI